MFHCIFCFSLTNLLVYCEMLQYESSEISSQASTAGLQSTLSVDNRALTMKFSGFNDKIETLVELFVKTIKVLNGNLQETLFNSIKNKLKKQLHNGLVNPNFLNSKFLEEALNNDNHFSYEVYKQIDKITFENFQNFILKYFQSMKAQVLAQGNITKAQTLQIVDIFRSSLSFEPFKDQVQPQIRCFKLPVGSNTIRMKSLMLESENSELMDFYQIGRETLHTRNLAEMTVSILHAKAYDVLRTKEQLGYAVACKLDKTKGVIGLKLSVGSQERKHSFAKVSERMNVFMAETVNQTILHLTDEDFEGFKASRIKSLLVEHKSSNDEFDKNWTEIIENQFVFDCNELSAKVTRNFTKPDLQDFFNSFTKTENLRKLSVQVIGNEKAYKHLVENVSDRELELEFVTEKPLDGENLIKNIVGFQNNLFIFPVKKFAIE